MIWIFGLLWCQTGGFMNQKSPDAEFWLELFHNQPAEFKSIINEGSKYQLQIIYSQVDRDERGKPAFHTYSYRVDEDAYFYPASSIKLYAAVLALEKINKLNIKGLSMSTPFKIGAVREGELDVLMDGDRQPTLEQYIRKVFVVSDNDAFSRLYEFAGQQYINERLHELGFKHTQILHRLSQALTNEENRTTNPFEFFDGTTPVFKQEAQYNPVDLYAGRPSIRMGNGYVSEGQLILEPKDFRYKNQTSLTDLHTAMQRIVFPEAFPLQKRFNLNASDYSFLYRTMGMLPRECNWPSYPEESYSDSYVKYLIFGGSKAPIPGHVHILNKVGQAYGYLMDNAYVFDDKTGVEFFLSAVIYVNENGIFNDDHYEYDQIGLPFLARLGRLVYEYEKERPREFRPDFTRILGTTLKSP